MTRTDQSPILRRSATVRRADALFQAMSQDFLLRQQFITNPVSILSEYLYGMPIASERALASNQLIYAVLSDRELLAWLHLYASDHRDHVPSGRRFLDDLAHAIVDHGGHCAVVALMRSSIEGNSLINFDEDLLHFFFNLGVFVTGSEAAAGHEASSEEDIEASYPSTCTAITWKTWLITRPAEEVDERFSANQPNDFGPRYVMVTLDELAIYAAELRRSGALALYPSRD